MNQYPTTPPPGGWPAPPMGYAYPAMVDPLSRSKRAGTLMIVLALLGLTCGGMTTFAARNFDAIMAMYPPEMRASVPANFDRETMWVQGMFLLVVSVVMLVLGVFVRRGNKAATVLGLIVTSLLVLQALVGLLQTMALAARGGGAPVFAIGMCSVVVSGGPFLWLLIWLRAALRGPAGAVASDAQAAYQAQYAQYVQQQQAYHQQMPYGQGAYNAAPPAAPSGGAPTGWQWSAPPPPPPPPAVPPQEPPGQASAEGGADGQPPQT